jgi:tetratricopeptide (TPR) repeat protein
MPDVLRPDNPDRANSLPGPDESTVRRRSPPRWSLPVLLLVYLAVYARSVGFAFVWDDPANSSQSDLMRGPLSGVIRKGEHARADPATERAPKNLVPAHESYRPVSVTSHWLDVRFFGDRPGPMHLHSLLLGLLSILLVHALGRALALGLWLPALWALHPLHVEVFAYISARSDLLAAIFSLSALLLALRSADAAKARARWLWAVAATLAQLVSLFAKEANLALPAAVLALAVARRKTRASLAAFTALLLGTAAYFPLRGIFMQAASLPMAQEKSLLRAVVDLPGVALAYTTSFLSPFSLTPDRHLWRPFVPLGWMVFVFLATSTAILFRRARLAARADLRLALCALLALGPLLLPAALGARSIGALSDRYAFFPFLFLAVAFLSTLRGAVRALANVPRTLWLAPIGIWGGLLIVTTWYQIGAWKNEETLARYSAAIDPDNSASLYRLATVATTQGQFVEALPLLEKAVAIDPTDERALNNLAVTYLSLNRVADAKAVLRRLLPLAGATDRRFWFNVASVQVADGKLEKACSALSRALEIDPGYGRALALRDHICPQASVIPTPSAAPLATPAAPPRP